MQAPEIPENEEQRLEALLSQEIMDTGPEDELDRITALLAKTLDTPIALVSLVDDERQWFKSRVGLDATETPREISFCGHAVASERALIVENALSDERFADNPLVTNAPDIRFYAGVPLKTTTGFCLGTLCAIDRKPRQLNDTQLDFLHSLAGVAERYLGLRHKMHEAEVSGEQFERMVGMAVHDLKNPLSAISGLAQLLQVGAARDPDEARLFVDRIASSTLSLESMIFNLLDLVTQRASSLKAHIRRGNIQSLLEQVVDHMSIAAQEKQHELSLELELANATQYFDEHLVRRIVQNLIMNAFHHSGHGCSVTVCGRSEANELVIEVRDVGCGIPDNQKAWVFKPFEQLEQRGSGANKGLGLSFCQLAAEAHDGSIEIEDNQPSGTRFIVRLPQPAS